MLRDTEDLAPINIDLLRRQVFGRAEILGAMLGWTCFDENKNSYLLNNGRRCAAGTTMQQCIEQTTYLRRQVAQGKSLVRNKEVQGMPNIEELMKRMPKKQ